MQHVGDGLDAAMGMPGKALDVLLGFIPTEIVQHEKGVKQRDLVETKGPPQMDAGAFDSGLTL
jgi:hypothetical protein